MAQEADVCLLLRSEKVTWRTRGKERLQEEARKEKIQASWSCRRWWEVTQALLEYEKREIGHSKVKHKECRHDVAVYTRTLLNQALSSALLSTRKVARVIKHILSVLHDRDLEITYHKEHLCCLCDLLENPKVSRFTQDPHLLADMFNYLKLVYIPRSPSLEQLRLLRALHKTIFLDFAFQSGILIEMLEWQSSILKETRGVLSLSSTSSINVISTICSCYTSLIMQHGSNVTRTLNCFVTDLLESVVPMLTLLSTTVRDPLIHFLDSLFDLLLGSTQIELQQQMLSNYLITERDLTLNPFSTPCHSNCLFPKAPDLAHLYDMLINENNSKFLLDLMNYGHGGGVGVTTPSSPRSSLSNENKLAFINCFDDSRFAVNIKVVAMTICFLESQECQMQNNDSSESIRHPVTSLYMSIHDLCSEVGSSYQNNSNAFTQTQSRSQLSKNTGAISRKHASISKLLLEAKLYILAGICVEDSMGNFLVDLGGEVDGLLENSFSASTCLFHAKMLNTGKWLNLLRHAFKKLLSLGRGVNGQTLGALVCTLRHFLIMSQSLLDSYKMNLSPFITPAIDAVRDQWASIFRLMTCPPSSSSSFCFASWVLSSCQRQTVSGPTLDLFADALRISHNGSSTLFRQSDSQTLRIWVLHSISRLIQSHDPREMDAPEFLKLLTMLQLKTPHSINLHDRLELGCNVTSISTLYLQQLEQVAPDGIIFSLYRRWLQRDSHTSIQPDTNSAFSDTEGITFIVALAELLLLSGQNITAKGQGTFRVYLLNNLSKYVNAFLSIIRSALSSCPISAPGDDIEKDMQLPDNNAHEFFPSGRLSTSDKRIKAQLQRYNDPNYLLERVESASHSCSSPSRVSTSLFEFLKKSFSVLELCEMLLEKLKLSCDEEDSNEHLTLLQLVVPLLSAFPLGLLQEAPSMVDLQGNKYDNQMLPVLKKIVLTASEQFWRCQDVAIRMLSSKTYLYKGNGSTSGCTAYHKCLMQQCTAAYKESERLSPTLSDIKDNADPNHQKKLFGNFYIKINKYMFDRDKAANICAERILKYLSALLSESSMLSDIGLCSRDASGRKKSSSPRNNKRRDTDKSANSFDDFDDDFMDIRSEGESSQLLDGKSNIDHSQILEVDNSMRKVCVGFNRDQVQIVCSVACCYLAASMFHADVNAVDDNPYLPVAPRCSEAIEKLMTALTCVTPPSDSEASHESQNKECLFYKLPSEIALIIAEQMAVLAYPSTAIHAFIVQNTWIEDWGVLGYHRVLGVLLSITSHSDYFVPYLRSGDIAVHREYEQLFNIIFCKGQVHDSAESERSGSEELDEEDIDAEEQRENSVLISGYLAEFWGNRFLQLECGANVFQSCPQGYKRPFGDIILKGLVDSDKRVNQVATAHLPMLFLHLPNHNRIFSSVKTYMGFDNIVHQSMFGYDDLEPSEAILSKLDDVQRQAHRRKIDSFEEHQEKVARMMFALASCGKASSNILADVIKDILFLKVATDPLFSSSDYVSVQDSSIASSRREQDLSDGTPFKSRSPINFKGVVYTLMTTLCTAHGYKSVRDLLQDHLYYLVQQWLAVHCMRVEEDHDDNDGENDEFGDAMPVEEKTFIVPLQAFPCSLLGFKSLQEFLIEEADWIVPLICTLTPSHHRWAQLLQYVALAGHLLPDCSEDHSIAHVIRENYHSIYGTFLCMQHFFFSVEPASESTNEVHKEDFKNSNTKKAQEMHDFLSRISSTKEMQLGLIQQGPALIVEHILCVASSLPYMSDTQHSGTCDHKSFWESALLQMSVSVSESSNEWSSPMMKCYALFDKELSEVLNHVAKLYQKQNKTLLLLSCDVICLLGRLRLLLKSTRSEFRKTCFSFCIYFLSKYVSSKLFLENVPSGGVGPSSTAKRQHDVSLLTRAMLHSLRESFHETPILLEVGTLCLKRMSDTTFSLIEQRPDGPRHLQVAKSLANCLPDLFSVVVFLICKVNVSLVSAFLESDVTSGEIGISERSLHQINDTMTEFLESTTFLNIDSCPLSRFATWQAMSYSCSKSSSNGIYRGHSKGCAINVYSCVLLRKVLLTLLNCGDLLMGDALFSQNQAGMNHPRVLTPLPRNICRLLFLDWECFQDFYTSMDKGGSDICSLIIELQNKIDSLNLLHSKGYGIIDTRARDVALQTLIGSIWRYLHGNLILENLIWLRLVQVRENLDPAMSLCSDSHRENGHASGDHEIESDLTQFSEVSLISAGVNALLALGKATCTHDAVIGIRIEIARLLGCLGFQNVESSNHHAISLSTRVKEVEKSETIEKICSSNIGNFISHEPTYIKIDLLSSGLLLSLFGSDTECAEASFRSIRALQMRGSIVQIQEDASHTTPISSSGKGVVLKSLKDSSVAVKSSLIVLDCLMSLPSSQPSDMEQENDSRFVLQCRGVVQNHNNAWGDELWSTEGKSYALWLNELVNTLVEDCYCHLPADSTRKDVNGKDKVVMFTGSKDEGAFITSLLPTANKNLFVAESLFQLLILDVLTNNKKASAVVARLFRVHILDPKVEMKEAVRLACETSTLLLRHDISQFRADEKPKGEAASKVSTPATKKRPLETKRPLDGAKDRDGNPYSSMLPIDHKTVAEAAMKCGCECTALLFLELAAEDSFYYWQRDMDESELDQSTMQFQPLKHFSIESDSSSPARGTSRKGKAMHRLPVDLLRSLYLELHDPDASSGVPPGTSLLEQARMCAHKGEWKAALDSYECILQLPASTIDSKQSEKAYAGVMTCLQALGYQSLFQQHVTSISRHLEIAPDSQLRNFIGQTSWRNYAVDFDIDSSGSSFPDSEAVINMMKWPEHLHTESSFQRVHEKVRITAAEDFIGSALAATMRDISVNRRDVAAVRLDECISQQFEVLLKRGRSESRRSLMVEMARQQHLVEAREIASSLGVVAQDHKLLSRFISIWRLRLSQGSAYNDIIPCEALLTLRLALLESLPAEKSSFHLRDIKIGNTANKHAVYSQYLHSVLDLVNFERGDANGHAAQLVTPLVQKVRSIVAPIRNAEKHLEGKSSVVTNAEIALFECQLLWKKNQHEVAVSTALEQIIDPLSIPLDSKDVKIKKILSEAYRSCGDWLVSTRNASGDKVLKEYLQPALDLSIGRIQQLKTHSTLAQYHLSMYQALDARVSSQEWKQSEQLILERRAEYEVCKEAFKELQEEYQSLCGNNSSALAPAGKSKKNQPPMTPEQSRVYEKLLRANRHLNVLKREYAIDAGEREEVENSVLLHLVQALSHYRDVIIFSSEANTDTMFHIVHLWMNHHQLEKVNSVMRDIVRRAASFHFVPLHYQIMSRLDGTATINSIASPNSGIKRSLPVESNVKHDSNVDCGKMRFQDTLTEVMIKLAKEHPFHILPQLFALKHEDMTWDNLKEYDSVLKKSLQRKGRIAAACAILNSVQHSFKSSKSSPYSHVVEGMSILFTSYIKLALTNMEKFIHEKKTKRIRFSELVSRGQTPFHECLNGVELSDSRHETDDKSSSKKTKLALKTQANTATFQTADFRIALLTKHHQVLPDASYMTGDWAVFSSGDALTYIHGFSPEFSLTDDGLSRPKIVKCLGSDGRQYTQLVKGGDDTRQDSVMEQVFDHVNTMLRRDLACSQRQLGIRTYKIVPTTPQSGIIEWVENTVAFGSYLCERPRDQSLGAHSRYHPDDLKSSECRGLMNEVKEKKSEEKERVFLAICRQFRPAFRYFFLEMFSDPSDWLTARMAYTRGVAAVSMVGYILGIGDRHAHNILVDTTTAEVVHIDFGIMFEQGKVIGTPETVPFRLTRDVVDGMGVNGVEGTFRRCCEEVLRVLRGNMAQLLTILEVVIHDPLYKWSLSPVQANARRQRQLEAQTNQAAANNDAQSFFPLGDDKAALREEKSERASSSSQDAAQRALLRVQNKLKGYDDPSGQSMSCSGQVQHVINEARDPKNLCKIFTGWTQWV